MKEKYETDMKKEIKKLQRVRDFCKQTIKENEIKDLSQLQDARLRIEEQMESFRVLEKELKQSKLNKDHFLNRKEIEGKFKFDSGDSDNYDCEDDDSDSSYRKNYDDEAEKSQSNDIETESNKKGTPKDWNEELNEQSELR